MNQSNELLNSCERGRYYVKSHSIYYDHKYLKNLVDRVDPGGWVHGASVNGLHWPIYENKNLPIDDPFFTDLVSQLNLNFSASTRNPKPWIVLSKLGAGGLNAHFDHRRWGGILIPISGDYANSPMLFVDEMSHVIEKVLIEPSKIHEGCFTPIFFNSRVLHAVTQSKENLTPRISLVINIHSHPDEMFDKAEQQSWLKSNTPSIGDRRG